MRSLSLRKQMGCSLQSIFEVFLARCVDMPFSNNPKLEHRLYKGVDFFNRQWTFLSNTWRAKPSASTFNDTSSILIVTVPAKARQRFHKLTSSD